MPIIRKHITLLAAVLTLACCNQKPQQKTSYSLSCGNAEKILTHTNSVELLRTEIQSHVRSSWLSNDHTRTDWIQAKSTFIGSNQEARNALSLAVEQPLVFKSIRSTPVFRLVKKDPQITVLEIRGEGGVIIEQAQTNSPNWQTISYLTESLLNDSLMRSLLTNKG